MSHKSTWLFPAIVFTLGLTAAALILSIPPLFSPYEPYQLWLTLVLGGLTMTLGAAVVLMRPPPAKRK